MNYKKLALLVAVVGMIALAGCVAEETSGNEDSGEKLAESTGNNVSEVNVGESAYFEMKITEKNQMKLVQKRPPFVMEDSLERQNLIRRYKYLNDRSNLHHVYMVSDDGKVINYEVAKGKVSSVNSKLTNDKQIVRIEGCKVYRDANGYGFTDGSCYKTMESPQMDGSYGTNGDAIFFFTPEGHYVEYNGKYIVSEQPKNIQTAVTLVDVENDSDS